MIDRAGVAVVHDHSSHHPLGIEIYRDRPTFLWLRRLAQRL
ncbi:CapA family protein [Candidatus Macondimonas diazotrophica]|uniref:Uncharacterized protein n=1 Tax=Candidatus Macondimonas diazotrophica TaxID=2305248 RepID=A0A4Z0FA60_9GAMM|nr:CapA family protein [Candidatus Macondimonas diazotrophica]TFZ82306.1 hypothetical protein E4680_08675 [Candidatus Macondimonas diazotrophica]HBG29284.1 hypothetical protein [Gammaproteobacteria bacterium]HBG51466.1 hypothetical protein [Gammaproteobacteria bacterium]